MTIWQRLSPTVGHFDRMDSLITLIKSLGWSGQGGCAQSHPERQVAFTIAVVALGAKMAKADGIVTEDEIHTFSAVFQVSDEERTNVRRIFDLARRDVAGYESYARQIARILKDDRVLLQHVMEGLFHIAVADGAIHPKEEEFLRTVAQRFGFSRSGYMHIRARFAATGEASPYDILLLDPSASDDELKAQYRRLVVENHPDKVMARGVPPELVAFANRKLAAINAAYDAIAKERGL
jgi:DnaJ like chaperone protein